MTPLGLTTREVPSVRSPIIEMSFGSGSADEWRRSLVSLSLRSVLAPGVDSAVIVLSASQEPPEVAVGDTGQIALGFSDSEAEPVFTGQVEGVARDLEGRIRVVACNGGAVLARTRVNQSYEQQSAGDIVSDLVGAAGLQASTEAGTSFPFYAVDDGRSVLEHVAALARKSDLVAYFTPAGELSLSALEPGGEAVTLSHGTDLLALHVSDASPVVDAVTAVGEGAAGSQGQDAWSWLLKDPSSVTGSTGEGAATRLVSDGSLRSSDAADSAAAGHAASAARARRTARAWAAGVPEVTLGSTVELAGVPHEGVDGQWIVTGVRHEYGHRAGFVTHLDLTREEDDGLPGGAP